ncbi:hypothetical protein Zmor_001423 [Zophobas morio]|uniref:Uncharacterized protein n=1 Tax=Zophobas morio TaxID=2755281 RepID=A0AA38MRX2_9CUCU|nr:hypothetical protein Zmor_001423 [Zophobas morio]
MMGSWTIHRNTDRTCRVPRTMKTWRSSGRSHQTGQRGRSRKVYHEIYEEANASEFGLTCEMPMKSTLAGLDANKWVYAMADELLLSKMKHGR